MTGLFLYTNMNLKQELPKELKPLAELMDSMSSGHGYNDIFTDWIDYMIACFRWDGDADLAERLKRKYGKQYPIFDKLIREYVNVMEEQTKRKEWYDGLGIIYETIASRWKSSAMGQFFTPPTIVDFMVMINVSGQEIGTGKTVSDPTCGSGRLLIAHHVHFPGNYQYGQDLDPICAKMSALNMMWHGCVGEVSCMNTLTMEWRFGYYINPYLRKFGAPQIVYIREYKDSNFYADASVFEQKKEKKESKQLTVVDVGELKKEPVKKEVIKKIIVKVEPAQTAQLSMF
jgi:type I restriction enzyme M protein